ncbi:hypothetical protein GCM10011391_32400 [Pullulanibacillus camelliae]|uniref:Uncharacterized protein n=1 Tax=Pullulanibacillus camelliae TaxID=1707096 RepID=A0A8J2YL59_9BACL|nr:hypothetical protein GCM10011391_32400 [Pullulanibacillus camelliae]
MMLVRVFFLFLGFGFAVVGGVTIIAFLNVMTTGEGFYGYIQFMLERVETYLFFAGLVMMWLSIYFPSFK